LERHLAALIFLAVAEGIAVCLCVPGAETFLESLQFGKVNIPIAVGLIVMMYPTMCAVRYESLATLFRNAKSLRLALLHHWVSGPFLMFSLAILFLRHQPEYMTGIILIGLARGIGGIGVWNKLAEGDKDLASGLAALNAIMQLAFYPLYAWFFLAILPTAIGISGFPTGATIEQFALSVFLYLGIPLLAGLLTRAILIRVASVTWYESAFLPRVMPLKNASMLVTLVMIFSLKTDEVLALPMQALLIAIPLVLYYLVMFSTSFYWNARRGASYAPTTTVAMTTASNNFELAVAVGVTVYGIDSAEAFATVVAPFVEVPIMIAFFTAAWYCQRRFFTPPEGARCLPPHLAHLGQSKLTGNAAPLTGRFR
jgi:ACR3 family arsenite transporter